MSDVTNPLLDRRFDAPLGAIRAEHVEPAIDALLAGARAEREALATADEPATVTNTLRALDRLGEGLDWAIGVVGHLESVATTPALRAAYNAVLPKVSAFHSELILDERIYRRLQALQQSDDGRALIGAERRFLERSIAEYEREGVALDDEAKARLEAIHQELSQVTTRFAEHLLDDTSEFALVIADEARLAGMPERAKAAARADARAHDVDGWRLTLHAPSLIPVLTYADDAALREALWRAYNSRAARAPRDNRALLVRILELRQEKAAILGYANFADYVLADRMAKDAATARAFVADLSERTRPYFERENAELQAFRRELEGAGAPDLQPWDVGYYAEKLRQRRYDFDREELRPYFNLEAVLAGMFAVAERLFGVRVEAVDPGSAGWPQAWHPDVRLFRVVDHDGTELGAFFGDFFPRDDKRGGAWMNALMTGGPQDDGGYAPHLGLLAANVTPPLDGAPAQMSHEEVETIFHEFGHLLHHLLSRVPVRSLAGTNVAWDFVELPSQIMENWCWEREALDMFARHVDTGATIPADLFQKLLAARTFRGANAMMRQLGFATLDLELHTAFEPAADPVAFARGIQEPYAATPLGDDYAMVLGFGHLFASPVGYAAGYYSYKWAEVLDADAFTRFQERGIFDRAVGRDFVEAILSRGDSEDPQDLFVRFMGREADPTALLTRSGLVEA